MGTITSSDVVVNTFFGVTLTVRVHYFSPPSDSLPTSPTSMSCPFNDFIVGSSRRTTFTTTCVSSSRTLKFPEQVFSFGRRLGEGLSYMAGLAGFRDYFEKVFFVLISPVWVTPFIMSRGQTVGFTVMSFPLPSNPAGTMGLFSKVLGFELYDAASSFYPM